MRGPKTSIEDDCRRELIAIEDSRWRSVAVDGNRRQTMAIKDSPKQSTAIKDNRRQSISNEDIRRWVSVVAEDNRGKRWRSTWSRKLNFRLSIDWPLHLYKLSSINSYRFYEMLDQWFITIGQAGTNIAYNAHIQTVQKYNYSLMAVVPGVRRDTNLGKSLSWKQNFSLMP